MDKVLTKRNVLLIVLFGTISLVFLGYLQTRGFCNYDNWCWSVINTLADFLFLFPIVFFIPLLTWRFGDAIFHSWLRFACWWIPIAALIIFTTPTTSHSWAIGGPSRDSSSIFMSGLFLFISLLLMGYKMFKLRRKSE